MESYSIFTLIVFGLFIISFFIVGASNRNTLLEKVGMCLLTISVCLVLFGCTLCGLEAASKSKENTNNTYISVENVSNVTIDTIYVISKDTTEVRYNLKYIK